MDIKKFEEYLANRYNKEITWYDNKAIRNQIIYSRMQFLLILFSSITPVTIAFSFGFQIEYTKWISVISSVIVAICGSSLKIFKFHENWINYRTICETLRKEIHLYDGTVGDYGRATDKESLFIERVESLISRENTLWFTTLKKDVNPS